MRAFHPCAISGGVKMDLCPSQLIVDGLVNLRTMCKHIPFCSDIIVVTSTEPILNYGWDCDQNFARIGVNGKLTLTPITLHTITLSMAQVYLTDQNKSVVYHTALQLTEQRS